MSERPVDRGAQNRGLLTTRRDSRQPVDTARVLENYRLPDGLPLRRPGFGFFGDDETRIQGQQLTRQTPSVQMAYRTTEAYDATEFDRFEKYPNGYGLIRHHDDFTPKSTRDWTVEFQLTLGELERLVTTPEDRKTVAVFNAKRRSVRNITGVFVFDQTLIASYCDFYDGDGSSTLRPPVESPPLSLPTDADITHTDTLALSSLAIGFHETEILATCTLIDTPGNEYFPYKVKLTHGITYGVGDNYHVAVRYTNSTRLLELIINGAAATGGTGTSTYTLLAAERFAGELDAVNNGTTAFDRDIVLLNECTVRGAYASTCKVAHVATGCSRFTQYKMQKQGGSNVALPPTIVTHCCPPRGTGMSELRIWHEARTNGELSSNDKLELSTPYDANLKGYWRLNDGGGILVEKVGEKHGSLHNTYPQFVANKNLLRDQGLNFADNQYIQANLGPTEYVEDAYSLMRRCMEGNDPDNINLAQIQYETTCDWTFQIQITVPYSAQDELTDLGLSGIADTCRWDVASEVRECPGDGTTSPNDDYRCHVFEVKDGQATPGTVLNDRGEENQGGTDNISMFHPAYDMTLFSVEGREEIDAADTDNHYDWRRVPLVRGLLTPDLEPVLEFYQDGNGSTADGPQTDYPVGTRCGRYLRIKGSALTPGNTYTLTFRKAQLAEQIGTPLLSIGFRLEIWVDGAVDKSKDYVQRTTATIAHTDTNGMMRAMAHRAVYDINVGASYVGDFIDRSETAPITDANGVVPPFRPGMLRNRCWQDHPGFFQMGFFRMWATTSLSDEDIEATWNQVITKDRASDPTLIINLEIDHVAPQILNKTRYVVPFNLGFKGWHVANAQEGLGSGGVHIWERFTWSNQDCLGYNRVPSDYLPTGSQDVPCNLLGLYAAVLARTYGLFSIFADSPFFDDDLSGDRQDVYVPVYGLLNEFVPNQKWEASVIADRMVMTAPGALPKIFDGKSIYTMGFVGYRGSWPVIGAVFGSGSLVQDKYFGARIAYFSEHDAIMDVTPLAVFYTTGTNGSLRASDINAHPDPRVTSYRIYRTVAQNTREEAEVAPLFLVEDGAFENKFELQVEIAGADNTLLDVVLDLNVTRPPFGSISGALDGVLWIGGDPLTGDAIYPADPGNPQRFDIVAGQKVVEEDSGENIVSILPLFGDLYISKPTSIHRMTPQGNNLVNILKVVGVGPISSRAIEVIVLPENGQTVIAFWSKFGPYLFDGARDQYIGEAIEINRAGGKPYDWLDADSVFILHDPTNRELQFRYKSVANGTTADRHDKAIVFNYRLKSWYHYGQTIGDCALSAAIANDGTIAAINAGSPTVGPVPLTPTLSHRLIVGGPNGHIYEWGTADRDGERTEVSTNPGTVDSWASPTITLTGAIFSAADVVRGNWITVYKADGSDWFSLPALSNTTTTVTLDLSYGAVKFAPANGQKVYVGQPPAEIEYPWDIMDRPAYNKSLQHFFLWFDKAIYYRLALDWDATNIAVDWTAYADSAGKRLHDLILAADGEAHKLSLHSIELGSRIDSYMFIVTDKMLSGLHQ